MTCGLYWEFREFGKWADPFFKTTAIDHSGIALATGATLVWSGRMTSPDFAEEPGLRGFPVPHDGLRRDVQHVSSLVDGQAAKESQFDNLAHTRIERRQSAERIVEGNEVVLLRVEQLLDVIKTHRNRTPATFLPVPVAGELHEDPRITAEETTPRTDTACAGSRHRGLRRIDALEQVRPRNLQLATVACSARCAS